MKGVVFGFFFFFALTALAADTQDPRWHACRSDANCIRAEGICGGYHAINGEYRREYERWLEEARRFVRCADIFFCHSERVAATIIAVGGGPRCCGGECVFHVPQAAFTAKEYESCGLTAECGGGS